MSRNRRIRSSKGQVPPIVDQISQIIIYDKPNKPQVPIEILKQSKNLKLGQGDIVVTRQDSSAEFAKIIKNVKQEKEDEDVEDEVEDEEVKTRVNIKTENFSNLSQAYDDCNESVTEDLFEEPAPSPPPTFKKPRGRPRKADSKQECTVLNFIIKHPINPDVVIDDVASEDNDNDPSQSPRPSRLRRKPARFSYAEAEEHYTIDTVSSVLKKRRNSQVSITPIYRSEQTEHDNVDNEVPNNYNKEKSPKKPAKKLTAKKGNQEDLQKKLQKNIKKEYNEEDVEEQSEHMDTSHEDLSESEDSRQGWEPEELAELKQQHVMKLIKNMHKCKFCPMEFATYYAVRKHRVMDHDDMGNVGKRTKKYKEADANETSDEEESRGEWMPQDYAEYKVKHSLSKLKKYGYKYNCKICLLKFTSYYQLSKHRLDHENQANPYECKYCSEKFNDVQTFTAHIRVHHGKNPYPCQKCSKGFDSRNDLDAHMAVHVLKKAPLLPKRFRCEICSKEFAKLGDVERHTRVHTGEKPAECHICHKRFQQQHNLTKHLLIHLHVKPFECEICNKKFGRIDVLNRHLLTHSMEKPFKCEFCNRGFIRHHQLTNHTDKAHPEIDFEMDDENGMMLENMTGEMTVTAVT